MPITRPILRLAQLTLFSLALAAAGSAHAEQLSGDALITALQSGGYVLLMRHAHSPHQPPAKADADPGNTALERQLDKEGKQSARAMGLVLKTLNIPVGTVLSSPTFRARQTVKFAGLGKPETHKELGDGGKSMSAKRVAAWADWLKQMVALPPEAGTNTVIVTHMPNIASVFPQAAKGMSDGETLVFHPDGKGGAQLVGDVRIEDWPGFIEQSQ